MCARARACACGCVCVCVYITSGIMAKRIHSSKTTITKGTEKGSLNERAEAIVNMGPTQENIAAMSSIRPVKGSTGKRAKWKPNGVKFSLSSRALIA